MRILFIADLYPPVLGGMELQVQALARGLATRDHEVSVATLTLDAPGVSWDEGVKVHRLRGWSRLLAPVYKDRARPYHPTFPDPGVVAALRRIIHAERPQVVSAHSWMVFSFLPLKSASGAALLMRLHDYWLVCPKKTYVYRDGVCTGPDYAKCLRCATGQYGVAKAMGLTTGLNVMNPFLRRAADLFVANSDAVADASYAGTGRPRSGTAVVPPWLSEEAFSSQGLPRPAFLPTGDFLMFAGSLGRHKGLDVLLEAYGGLATRVPLILVGMPREDTPTRLPEGARIICNVPHKDVLAAWPHCAVALVPSIWPEAFGLVAAEAMAAGRPVIASAIGGLKDVLVDGETGLLVPPGDPESLRDAIVRLLENPLERERMGMLGKRRAARYSMSRLLPEMEGFLEGLVRMGQAHGR